MPLSRKPPPSINTSDWTEYQQLVLHELQRHEAKLQELSIEIVALKLTLVRIEHELKTIMLSTQELAAKISSVDKARETNNLDVRTLTMKLTALIAGISTVLGFAIQFGIKFFLP